jgi:hypothetical protein
VAGKMIANAPATAQHQPALAVAAKPKKQRVCRDCGVEVFGKWIACRWPKRRLLCTVELLARSGLWE